MITYLKKHVDGSGNSKKTERKLSENSQKTVRKTVRKQSENSQKNRQKTVSKQSENSQKNRQKTERKQEENSHFLAHTRSLFNTQKHNLSFKKP